MHKDWPLELLVTIFLGGRKGSEITLLHAEKPAGMMKEMTQTG
jgi:hypothetical protein